MITLQPRLLHFIFSRVPLVRLLIFFIPISIYAQQENSWKIQHIGTETGLSNRFVNCIMQDNRGFTWMGTNFGLNRYDGHRVDILTRESNHLQTNTIFQLSLDVNQNIWVIQKDVFFSPIQAIDILDPISFKVEPLENYIGKSMPFSTKEIKGVWPDSLFRMYILTTNNDVYRFDQKGLHLLIHSPSAKPIFDLGVNTDMIIIENAERNRVELYDTLGNKLNQFPTLTLPSHFQGEPGSWYSYGQLNPGEQLFIYGDVNHVVSFYTILTRNGFSAIKPISTAGHSRQLSGFDIYQKKMWGLENADGLFVHDLQTGEYQYPPYDNKYNLKYVFNDPTGLTWLGNDNGVQLLSKRPKYFTSYLVIDKPFYSCRGFSEDRDGNILVLTHGGNFIFHPDTKTIEPWHLEKLMIGLGSTTDKHGDIWFSGEQFILFRYHPATSSLAEYAIPLTGYFAVWSIAQAGTGQILLGTTKGLWIKDPDNNLNPIRFSKLNGENLLNESTIYHILETEEGIWLSTDNGLFLVDLEDGVKTHIDEQDGLPINSLLYLHKDADNMYWIASRGGGLIRWDKAKNIFKSYTVNEGLSHNIIYAVLEDDFGFLWMPSDLGLMRFEKATGICRTFLQPEGIPHEEFNRVSYFKDHNGNMYFGTLNGFIVFNPKDLLNVNAVNLPVRLTKFEAINEKTGTSEDLTYEAATLQAITLSPQVSSFLIHYSILDYDDPKLKRYAYKIDGLNTNWTYLTENFIRINGMKGGDYTIHIKGQSSTGQWSGNELVIPITMLKPFFARWYTQGMILLLLGGLLYYIIRKRSALQKAKLEREMAVSKQLRQVDKLKDQFLANTSHELRTPLNGMIGLVESLRENSRSEEEKEDLELVISSGRRLSNLVNDILDFSRLKEHDLQLNLKPVDIRTIADLCLRMNRQLVQNKNIVLQNHIPEDIPYCMADENRLQQILQNLVANAMKFTKEGSVTIDAQEVEGMIIISVSDTGIGIPKEKQDLIFKEFEQADGSIGREFGGTGLGLSISKYLVELHGGTIGVVSEPGKGSIFSFSIPVAPFAPKSPKGDFIKISSLEGGREGANVVAPKSPKGDFIKIDEKQSSSIERVRQNHSVYNTKNDKKSPSGDLGAGRKILVVDDEPVNLKVLKNHLEREGYQVTLAHDGQEALSLLSDGHQFHLVLLDVMMPRISGYEVCQKIRERYLSTELPVIMVTAKNQVNDLVEGFDIGTNDYIVKPFSRDELLARVKAQLENFGIHEATNRFVPHEFIHSLGRQTIMDLQRGDMVEQNVHVMFSDIRDYTTLAEDMSPKENFQFVNNLAGRVGPIVKSNHGMINQYLGDTIMMLFMKKADDGLQAGIDILRLIRQYNQERKSKTRKPIRIGLGLHSGPLMMGIIGDSMRTDAAVISDTVNTASRMEGLTKYYNVNFILSADTVQKLSDHDRFNLRYLGKVQAKGKLHTLDIYECFDGDSDEQIILKKSSAASFHAGMEAYFAKDMNAARRLFDQVYQVNPEDTTVLGFLHRIHNHLIQGLPAEWNGVEVMLNK
jgi:signal transduction histidine kinase/class 3 adenylate cyclase/ligand-binding sensor domain-containing protein/FixJ family two-component response regulator